MEKLAIKDDLCRLALSKDDVRQHNGQISEDRQALKSDRLSNRKLQQRPNTDSLASESKILQSRRRNSVVSESRLAQFLSQACMRQRRDNSSTKEVSPLIERSESKLIVSRESNRKLPKKMECKTLKAAIEKVSHNLNSRSTSRAHQIPTVSVR